VDEIGEKRDQAEGGGKEEGKRSERRRGKSERGRKEGGREAQGATEERRERRGSPFTMQQPIRFVKEWFSMQLSSSLV